MKTRNILIVVAVIAVIIVGVIVVQQFIVPSFTPAQSTAMPTARNPFSTPGTSALPNPRTSLIAYYPEQDGRTVAQTAPKYVSCVDDRSVTPTPTQAAEATAAATMAETMTATMAVTGEATAVVIANELVVRVVGAESEACYQVGEVFLGNNQFGLAVGVTKTIDGFIKIDRDNIANSQLGEIVIDISKFESDSPRRDGIIRQRWLESNKYPTAVLSNAKFAGLPTAKYTEGETVEFTMTGDLKLQEKAIPTTFTMTATLTGDTLVATGYADVKMSDWGITAPEVGGFVRANDDFRIILNIVARPE